MQKSLAINVSISNQKVLVNLSTSINSLPNGTLLLQCGGSNFTFRDFVKVDTIPKQIIFDCSEETDEYFVNQCKFNLSLYKDQVLGCAVEA